MENTERGDLKSKNGDDLEKLILMPLNYFQQIQIKFYTNFLKIFNVWFKVPEDKLKQIDEIIVTVTYIVMQWDDIQDNAVMSRGIPSAHSIYGIPCTSNAANMAFLILMEKCLELNHPDAIGEFIETFMVFFRGQGIELYWRDNYTCPSEEEYIEMATQKVGEIFMIMIRLMQLFSDNRRDFKKIVDNIGLYCQILDDYLNLKSETYNLNSYCDDITEGKFSFPIIHAIHSSAEAKRSLMNTLRQRTGDKEVLKSCVDLLESCGSFEYTRKKLVSLRKELKEEVAKLGLEDFLEQFLSLVPDRATPEEIVSIDQAHTIKNI